MVASEREDASGQAADTGEREGPRSGVPVFLSWREERVAGTGPRAARSGAHINFFAVTNHGNAILAATGDDQGDAHYQYNSSPDIEALGITAFTCHNRSQLMEWLNGLIADSQRSANFKVQQAEDMAHLAEIQAGTCPSHFPGFVAYRMEKFQLPCGQRLNKWWLLDEFGQEHLAVVGEERETRDGHYLYRTEEPFTSTHPLQVGSQSKVLKWVESMIAMHPPRGEGAQAAGGPATSGHSDGSNLVSKSGTRGWQRPSVFMRPGSAAIKGGPSPLMGGPKSMTKRQKALKGDHKGGQGGAGDPEAQSALELLAKWAAGEAAHRATQVHAAMAWLQDAPDAATLQTVEHYVERARKLLDGRTDEQHATPMELDGHMHQLPTFFEDSALRSLEAVEVLQELGCSFLPASVMKSFDLIPLMQQLAVDQDSVISSMAARILRSWQLQTAHYLRVLTSSEYLQDPCDELLGMVGIERPAPKELLSNHDEGAQPQHAGQAPQFPQQLAHMVPHALQTSQPDSMDVDHAADEVQASKAAASPALHPTITHLPGARGPEEGACRLAADSSAAGVTLLEHEEEGNAADGGAAAAEGHTADAGQQGMLSAEQDPVAGGTAALPVAGRVEKLQYGAMGAMDVAEKPRLGQHATPELHDDLMAQGPINSAQPESSTLSEADIGATMQPANDSGRPLLVSAAAAAAGAQLPLSAVSAQLLEHESLQVQQVLLGSKRDRQEDQRQSEQDTSPPSYASQPALSKGGMLPPRSPAQRLADSAATAGDPHEDVARRERSTKAKKAPKAEFLRVAQLGRQASLPELTGHAARPPAGPSLSEGPMASARRGARRPAPAASADGAARTVDPSPSRPSGTFMSALGLPLPPQGQRSARGGRSPAAPADARARILQQHFLFDGVSQDGPLDPARDAPLPAMYLEMTRSPRSMRSPRRAPSPRQLPWQL